MDNLCIKIHLCNFSQQPDVKIFCNEVWTTPKWGNNTIELPSKVYEADNGSFYTFDIKNVTCWNCKEKCIKKRQKKS